VSGRRGARPPYIVGAIDRAAVRCVLQRSSSRQYPMRRRTVWSWNMLMKEARFVLLWLGTLCATSFYLDAGGLATPRAGLSSSSSSSALRYNHLAQPSQVQALAQP
tara:strand:+ start:60 stop:377 length:318 start_codon:yes stop_codon:yes gene_type:complete